MADPDFVSLLSLDDQFSRLCCKETRADVWFLCQSKETQQIEAIPGHKWFLCLRSHKFDLQFGENWAESNGMNNIHIDDVSAEAFTVFMHFIYESSCEFDVTLAAEILILAKMYLLKDLKTQAMQKIESHLESFNESCLMILQGLLAAGESDSEIFGECRALIAENASQALKQDVFLKITPETLMIILKIDQLGIEEVDLCLAVIKWAKEECKRRDLQVTDANQKVILQPYLHYLRFPTMEKMGDLSKVMKECRLLNVRTIGKILLAKDDVAQRQGLPWNFEPRTKFTPLEDIKLLILGGVDDDTGRRSTILEYNASTGTQRKSVTLNKKRQACTAALVNDTVFVFGGTSANEVWEKTAEVCNLSQHNSTPPSYISNMPHEIGFTASCVIGTKVFLLGSKGHPYGALCYDVDTDSWTTIADIPIHTNGASALTYNQGILLLGGNNTGAVFYYDIQTNKWQEKVQLKLPNLIQYCESVKLADGSIVVCGGSSDGQSSNGTNKCWKLSPNANKWHQLPSLKIKRSHHRAILCNGNILVLGGVDAGGTPLKSVEMFVGGRWKYVADLDKPLSNFSVTLQPIFN